MKIIEIMYLKNTTSSREINFTIKILVCPTPQRRAGVVYLSAR